MNALYRTLYQTLIVSNIVKTPPTVFNVGDKYFSESTVNVIALIFHDPKKVMIKRYRLLEE